MDTDLKTRAKLVVPELEPKPAPPPPPPPPPPAEKVQPTRYTTGFDDPPKAQTVALTDLPAPPGLPDPGTGVSVGGSRGSDGPTGKVDDVPIPGTGIRTSVGFKSKQGVEWKGSIDVGQVQTEPGLRNTVNFSVKAQGGFFQQASGTIGPVTVGGKATVGAGFSYSVKMPESAYRQIQQSPAQGWPNPFDPTSLPPGGGITFAAEDYYGKELSADYKAKYGIISGKAGVTEVEGVTIGVSRSATKPNLVQVYVGPHQGVDNELAVSLKDPKELVSVGVGGKQSVRGYQMATAQFDISTKEGRAAYDKFIQSAQFPANAPPAVRTGHIEQTSYSNTQYAELKVDLKGKGIPLDPNFGAKVNFTASANLKETRWDDGEVERELVYSDNGSQTSKWSQKITPDPAGELVSGGIQVVDGGVNAGTLNHLAVAFGNGAPGYEKDPQYAGDKNAVQLNFTEEEAKKLAALAQQYTQTHPTADPNGTTALLANAKSPAEVMWILQSAPGGASRWSTDLARLAQLNGGSLPGSYSVVPAACR